MSLRPRGFHWPVLKRYDQDHIQRVAMPLGGIGTGTVSLGGRGDLRDWEIMNRPAKGHVPLAYGRVGPFFALFTRWAGGVQTRALEGPLGCAAYEGDFGSTVPNNGLPRFRRCSFAAAYPLAQVFLRDPAVPLDVRLEAFNPMIPGDSDRSSIPVAVLRYRLRNRTAGRVTAAVCASLPNFVGMDGSQTKPNWIGELAGAGAQRNRNRFRAGRRVRGILMDSEGVDPGAEAWGTLALTTIARAGVSFRAAWLDAAWGTPQLDFWDDFGADGVIEKRAGGKADMPVGSLAVRTTVPARGERMITFLLTWHFPNRQSWTPRKTECAEGGPADSKADRVGNYYATRYRDAWDVAERVAARLPELESDTIRFVEAFCESDLPDVVKEAALFNLANLRSQTCFRTADGRFFGWEGCGNRAGCCYGSCTHVWNYEQATPFLYGDLARSMRETEFVHATRDDGLMSFRVHLPLARACDFGKAAADGQMGCIMKMYRDWQLSGDDAMLRRLWPRVRKAVEFCWIGGGWDADRDGVMEGCQHNTMDVEYYGPNPQMGTWYLGALRAAEEMGRYLGDADFAQTCRRLFERGSRWMDENLFNGEYYEHRVRPPARLNEVAESLCVGMGATDARELDYQLGSACLVDQLIGQYMAHICGLGYLLDPDHVRTTLRSIMKHNLKQGFDDHFNCLRSFALGDESGLLMARYPKRRPRNPFPYFTEVMTGFEYAAAVGMRYEGQTEAALRCIRNIRNRYDGRKRSPFDEAECGHHYARAMASWAAVVAWTGFEYSGVSKTMRFAAKPGTFFWSNGYAWGTCVVRKVGPAFRVALSVRHGDLVVSEFVLRGVGAHRVRSPQRIGAGQKAEFRIGRI